jgi:hypothetical protein
MKGARTPRNGDCFANALEEAAIEAATKYGKNPKTIPLPLKTELVMEPDRRVLAVRLQDGLSRKRSCAD